MQFPLFAVTDYQANRSGNHGDCTGASALSEQHYQDTSTVVEYT